MSILIWIVFGAIVGWVASAIMKSDQGIVWDIAIGIVGAMLGGFMMSLIGESGVSGFNLYSFLVAILGACVLIAIVRQLRHHS